MSESEENPVQKPSTPILDELNWKGRRPTLPTLTGPTQRDLLQLLLPKEDSASSWNMVLGWFQKLFPRQNVIRDHIESLKKEAKTTKWERASLDILVLPFVDSL
ncbi:hypothetical protein PoB_004102900 [Plakobranchus ocellatus]|uniref:Uncharacterized protein n=1 Tax=Plakobranchus ocellatus TaxID=259542 RepID=A0AAV4B3B1_9GAST|nr:hypothetical protein PoB_004102900 [Plakobranchus ocellatus]